MKIAVRANGATDRTLLALSGDLDLSAADALGAAVGAAVGRGARRITIDLGQVAFCDSSGVDALVSGWQRATDAGVHLQVTNPHGIVHRVLEITGVLGTLVEDR
jgi:anti-sigma B factor antagonist